MCGLRIAKAGAKPASRVRNRAGVAEVQRPQAGAAGIVAIAATEREPFPRYVNGEVAYRVANTLWNYTGSL